MKKMLFITAFGLFLAADGAVAGMILSSPSHARVVRDRVLVAVPLIAHTLAFERLILGRRNFQFLVSKVAPDPVPKHLDILLRRCSNSSLRTHGSFQVRTALLDCSGKVMVNCCPKSRSG